MRDRFPLLVVGGLLFTGIIGYALMQGARRGSFADRLSTFRSEPDGSRGLYLLLSEQGLPVARHQLDLTTIPPERNFALLGVDLGGHSLTDLLSTLGTQDGGVDDDDQDDAKLDPNHLRAPAVTPDEVEKLLEHVQRGATVIYAPTSDGQHAGGHDDPLLQALDVFLIPAEVGAEPRTLVPAQPSPYTRGVERVETPVPSFLDLPPGGVALLIEEERQEAVLGVVPHGQGRVVLLSAPELAMNRRLGLADNAQLWLSLVGASTARGALGFDEYHHGFTQDRSMGAFAARYGLHYAFAQLLLGVALWALALRRFGRSRPPAEQARLASADALSATTRLYREGRHVAHAAEAITAELTFELAQRAGVSGKSPPAEVASALEQRGRADLARALRQVADAAAAATHEAHLRDVARQAALARWRLHRSTRGTPT